MNKLCTRTLYELDGTPHVRVDEYMKHRLQNKLIRAILKDSLSSRSVTPFPACVCVLYQRPCVHYTELCFGFVGRSLTKPAQIVDIFLSAWDFSCVFISGRPKAGIFVAAVLPLSSGAWLPLNTTCTYTLLFIFPALCSLGE